MRFGIRALMVLTTLVALFVCALVSRSNAVAEARLAREKTDEILSQIYPSVTFELIEDFKSRVQQKDEFAEFLASYPPEEHNVAYFGSGRPYNSVGNSRYSVGGPLGSPVVLSRTVCVEMLDPSMNFFSFEDYPVTTTERVVQITVEQRLEWYPFAGSPITTIYAHDAPKNSLFLDLLTKELRAEDIAFEVEHLSLGQTVDRR